MLRCEIINDVLGATDVGGEEHRLLSESGDFSHYFTTDKGVNAIDRLPVSISGIDWPDFSFFEPPEQRAQRPGLVISPTGPSANADQFTATLAAAGAHYHSGFHSF